MPNAGAPIRNQEMTTTCPRQKVGESMDVIHVSGSCNTCKVCTSQCSQLVEDKNKTNGPSYSNCRREALILPKAGDQRNPQCTHMTQQRSNLQILNTYFRKPQTFCSSFGSPKDTPRGWVPPRLCQPCFGGCWSMLRESFSPSCVPPCSPNGGKAEGTPEAWCKHVLLSRHNTTLLISPAALKLG